MPVPVAVLHPAAVWAAQQVISYAQSPAGREAVRRVGHWFAAQLATPIGKRLISDAITSSAEGMRRAGVPVPTLVEEAASMAASFGVTRYFSNAAQPVRGTSPNSAKEGEGST